MALISTRLLELRKRRGLMVVVGLLTFGLPFLVLGLRLVFHLLDAKSYGPAGSPGVFDGLTNAMAEFGFIAAAVLGTSAGTTDLSDGVFRHLVITGRSRVALFAARIPAGLAIVLPFLGVAFAATCLVVAFAGTSQPTTVNLDGVKIPLGLSEAQLKTWLIHHESEAVNIPLGGVVTHSSSPFGSASSIPSAAGSNGATGGARAGGFRKELDREMNSIYSFYEENAPAELNPPANEMVKIGLWLELDALVGFTVGLGLGALTGQRTASTVLMVVLEVIVSPIMANVHIPHFVNGQRLFVGVALDQLRPAGMLADFSQGGPGRRLFGGRASLGIGPMPNWVMISVIVGWIVVWTAVGAWRMATRDA